MTDAELQSLRNLGNESERAADEIVRLRDAVRSARADEEHCWARRIDGLNAQLREVDARYMALLKAVADGVAMQPKTVVLDLGAVAAERERWAGPVRALLAAHDAGMRQVGEMMRARGLTSVTLPIDSSAEFDAVAALRGLVEGEQR